MKSRQVSEFKETEIGRIPSDWKVKKLSEIDTTKTCVQTGPFGSLLHSHDYQEEGHPLILVKHVKGGQIIEDDLPKIGEQKYSVLSKFILKEGDIVFTRVGYVGNTAYVEKKHNGWLFSGQTLRIRLDNPIINNRFVAYFFLTENFKNIASSVVLGSTRDSINTQILKDIQIPIPPIDEQEKIVSIINSLINKIQNLQNQNKTLEQITQSIFKSWFIDFDGQTEFVDSELGNVPENWAVKNLEDIVRIKGRIGWRGYTIQDLRDNGPLVIGGKHITSEHTLNLTDPTYISFEKFQESPEIQIHKGDIIITKNGNSAGQIALVDRDMGPATINPNVVLLKECSFHNYLFYYMIAPYGQKYLISGASSGSAIPTINNQTLKKMKIIIPNTILLKKFETIASSLRFLIESNNQQINTLTKIRDSLLPKLMSGEIRV